MAHRLGQNLQQFGLFVTPLDEMVSADNIVRVIDAFVGAIDLDQLGFTATCVAYSDQDYKTKEEGFQKEDFEYDTDKDVYICPTGEEPTTTETIKYG